MVERIPVLVEMIDESANPEVDAHPKAKTEKAQIVERHHCVLITLGDDKEGLRVVVVSARGIGPPNGRRRLKLPKNAARLACQIKFYLFG